MATQELSARVTLDDSQLPQAAERVEKTLGRAATSYKEFAGGAQAVRAPLQQAANVTGAANFALLDTTRIIEDIPFGLRGIANNITPAIQSFQRLSTQSKAAGVSMKTAILGALGGPGGIIALFSLASSAALIFGSRTRKGMSEAAAGMETARKAAQSLGDTLASALGFNQKAFQAIQAIDALVAEYEAAGRAFAQSQVPENVHRFNEALAAVGRAGGLDKLREVRKQLAQSAQKGIDMAQVLTAVGVSLDVAGTKATRAKQKFADFTESFGDFPKLVNKGVKPLEGLPVIIGEASLRTQGLNASTQLAAQSAAATASHWAHLGAQVRESLMVGEAFASAMATGLANMATGLGNLNDLLMETKFLLRDVLRDIIRAGLVKIGAGIIGGLVGGPAGAAAAAGGIPVTPFGRQASAPQVVGIVRGPDLQLVTRENARRVGG